MSVLPIGSAGERLKNDNRGKEESTVIPAIGIMIGAYILLRCFEMFATLDRVQSRTAQAGLAFAAIAVVLVTIVCGWSMLESGNAASEALQNISPGGIFKPPR